MVTQIQRDWRMGHIRRALERLISRQLATKKEIEDKERKGYETEADKLQYDIDISMLKDSLVHIERGIRKLELERLELRGPMESEQAELFLKQVENSSNRSLRLNTRSNPLKSFLQDTHAFFKIFLSAKNPSLNPYHIFRLIVGIEPNNLPKYKKRKLYGLFEENRDFTKKIDSIFSFQLNSFKIVINSTIPENHIKNVIIESYKKIKYSINQLTPIESEELTNMVLFQDPAIWTNDFENNPNVDVILTLIGPMMEILQYLNDESYKHHEDHIQSEGVNFEENYTNICIRNFRMMSTATLSKIHNIKGLNTQKIIKVETGQAWSIIESLNKAGDLLVFSNEDDQNEEDDPSFWKAILSEMFSVMLIYSQTQLMVIDDQTFFLFKLTTSNEDNNLKDSKHSELPSLGLNIFSVNIFTDNKEICAQNLLLYHVLTESNKDKEEKARLLRNLANCVSAKDDISFIHNPSSGNQNPLPVSASQDNNKIEDDANKKLMENDENFGIKTVNIRKRISPSDYEDFENIQVGSKYKSSVYFINLQNFRKHFGFSVEGNYDDDDDNDYKEGIEEISKNEIKYVLKIIDNLQLFLHFQRSLFPLSYARIKAKNSFKAQYDLELKIYSILQNYNKGKPPSERVRIPKFFIKGKLRFDTLVNEETNLYLPHHDGKYLISEYIPNRPDKIAYSTYSDGMRQINIFSSLRICPSIKPRNIRINDESEVVYIDLGSFREIDEHIDFDKYYERMKNQLKSSLRSMSGGTLKF